MRTTFFFYLFFFISGFSYWQIWIQKHCLRPQIMLMQRQLFVSLQTMQLTGSTGAGLQLVGHHHLMVSLSTFVVPFRFILWVIYRDNFRGICNKIGSQGWVMFRLFDVDVFLWESEISVIDYFWIGNMYLGLFYTCNPSLMDMFYDWFL